MPTTGAKMTRRRFAPIDHNLIAFEPPFTIRVAEVRVDIASAGAQGAKTVSYLFCCRLFRTDKFDWPYCRVNFWIFIRHATVFLLARDLDSTGHTVRSKRRRSVTSEKPQAWRFAGAVALLAGTAFYFSTKAVHQNFDYTYRVALALLRGHVGLTGAPPSWLSEIVPVSGKYYSVFPLGAVLVNIPVALLRKIGLIHNWPAHELAAVLAASCVFFFYRLSHVAEISRARRVLLSLFPMFATWSWCNLGFAGAWQIALGFALLGQAASLYYTLVRRNPLLAGAWFAVALGNRTELFLTLPFYIYFWLSRPADNEGAASQTSEKWSRPHLLQIGKFLVIPAGLLLCTAIYNYSRFGSVIDFGYGRIPGLLKEPWYQHGLFSLHAIRWNAYEMLFRGVLDLPNFPYLQPGAFGCSIFIASPFLFFLFREGGRHRAICWSAIGLLTFFLWCHGNAGGWQFSYRYAMILLPWMFLLVIENGPPVLTATETTLFIVSVLINGLAVYEFLWTNMIHP